MKALMVAAVLALTTLASSWLTGPFGPCEPATNLGVVLLLVALLGSLASWALALVGFIQIVRSSKRATLIVPSIVAAIVVVLMAVNEVKALPAGMQPMAATIARRVVVNEWPPLMALFIVAWSLVRARFRTAKDEAK